MFYNIVFGCAILVRFGNILYANYVFCVDVYNVALSVPKRVPNLVLNIVFSLSWSATKVVKANDGLPCLR